MFERFTKGARQALVGAQRESRALKHQYIGCEHLLLALAGEHAGDAAGVLEANGLTHAAIRAEVVRVVGEGQGRRSSGQIPFTPSAKRAFETAAQQARKLGHSYIDTEHLLLGLLAWDDYTVGRIVTGLGVDLDQLRTQVESATAAKPLAEPRREPDLTAIEDIAVTLSPRARSIWMAAAARALKDGRTQVLPGDLLEPLLGEWHISSLLVGVGYDPAPLLERLSYMSWQEPDTLDEG